MFSCLQVEEFSNRVAHYFKSVGLRRGDTVALFMESKPEYVCIWLGLSKIGVVTALINSNLRQSPLVHTIKIANSRAIIFGSELATGEFAIVSYLYMFLVQC
jgi:solute carrier family 27 fatty acid transporter 1/4